MKLKITKDVVIEKLEHEVAHVDIVDGSVTLGSPKYTLEVAIPAGTIIEVEVVE